MTHSAHDQQSGFVLAGGASRRMGTAKARLVLDREVMLSRQVRLLGRIVPRVAVAGYQAEDVGSLDVPLIPDVFSGRGPLGGIYSALMWTRTEYNLFVGCDMPFLRARLLRYLIRRAVDCEADVTVPESRDRRLQTLCAVYRRRARWAVRASLSVGDNRLRSILPRVTSQVIPWRELAHAGFLPWMFGNMNFPADYESARRRIERLPATPA